MPENEKEESGGVITDSGVVPEKLTVTRKESETEVGVEWDFEQAKLKKKNKTDPDRFALVPVRPKTPEDFRKWLDFLNEKQAALTSYARVRGMSANWTKSSTVKATGKFILNDFINCVENMSARGETFKALNDERGQLTDEIIALSKDTKMALADKVAKMNEIGTRLNEINIIITERQEKGDTEDDEVEETPVAA
jgi:hypothetical protein